MNPNVKAIQMAKLERTAKALTQNRMEARVVADKEELLKIIREMMPKGASVATGGSMTLEETGINALLSSGDYDFYFRGRTDENGQPVDVFRAAFSCDWYLASANAITEDGKLYNVDGNANRVAALCYGPKHVIIVAGCNKVVRDLAEADERVRTIAAPANCVRLGKKNPCTVIGRCADCRSEDRVCCDTVIHGFQRDPERIKVFLLPEELGY
jgi:L-lactate utilization protein LutB